MTATDSLPRVNVTTPRPTPRGARRARRTPAQLAAANVISAMDLPALVCACPHIEVIPADLVSTVVSWEAASVPPVARRKRRTRAEMIVAAATTRIALTTHESSLSGPRHVLWSPAQIAVANVSLSMNVPTLGPCSHMEVAVTVPSLVSSVSIQPTSFECLNSHAEIVGVDPTSDVHVTRPADVLPGQQRRRRTRDELVVYAAIPGSFIAGTARNLTPHTEVPGVEPSSNVDMSRLDSILPGQRKRRRTRAEMEAAAPSTSVAPRQLQSNHLRTKLTDTTDIPETSPAGSARKLSCRQQRPRNKAHGNVFPRNVPRRQSRTRIELEVAANSCSRYNSPQTRARVPKGLGMSNVRSSSFNLPSPTICRQQPLPSGTKGSIFAHKDSPFASHFEMEPFFCRIQIDISYEASRAISYTTCILRWGQFLPYSDYFECI